MTRGCKTGGKVAESNAAAFPKPRKKDRVSAKRDAETTAAQKYLDQRSYRTIDGKEWLAGLDMMWRRREVWAKYRGRCAGCSREIAFDLEHHMELDHIIPRGRGGDDSVGNLQPLGGAFACQCHRGRVGSKHA